MLNHRYFKGLGKEPGEQSLADPVELEEEESLNDDHNCISFELSIKARDYTLVNVKKFGLRFKQNKSGQFISFCPYCGKYLYEEYHRKVDEGEM